MKIQISLSARLVKHLPHQPNQSKSNLSRQAPLSQQEADEKVIPQCIHSLVTPQQTGSNPLVILRCCSVGYSTMHSFSKLHRGWEWKSSLTHYPTTTTNKYPLVRFRCINVKMTREFGWDGMTRWQESYSTSPIPPSYLVAWLVLFVSPMPPSYLVAWFILFVINQVHLHIWLFGLSRLLSTNFTIIFGCSQYFQQGWTHQCRYIWNNVGLLCCPGLLEVVVASDSGKYQQPTVVGTILVILVNAMLPTNYFNSSAVASYTVIRSDHNKSNMCPRQSLVFWIHPYCWVRNKSIHHI